MLLQNREQPLRSLPPVPLPLVVATTLLAGGETTGDATACVGAAVVRMSWKDQNKKRKVLAT